VYALTFVGLQLVPCAVWINMFPRTMCTHRHFLTSNCTTCCAIWQFPLYYLTCNQHYKFPFKRTLNYLPFQFLEMSSHGAIARFRWSLMFIKSCFFFCCCIHLHLLPKLVIFLLHCNTCFPSTDVHQYATFCLPHFSKQVTNAVLFSMWRDIALTYGMTYNAQQSGPTLLQHAVCCL
jgi:hypothetical protein